MPGFWPTPTPRAGGCLAGACQFGPSCASCFGGLGSSIPPWPRNNTGSLTLSPGEFSDGFVIGLCGAAETRRQKRARPRPEVPSSLEMVRHGLVPVHGEFRDERLYFRQFKVADSASHR